eukprot:CCRYP_001117-RB/>CCRYP_001117-RB protein AED:0.15 eAED:0.22 QI:0/1/0.78/1/1/0.92/14/0/3367
MTDTNRDIHGGGFPSPVPDAGDSESALDTEATAIASTAGSRKDHNDERSQALTGSTTAAIDDKGDLADAHRDENDCPPSSSLVDALTKHTSENHAQTSLTTKQPELPHNKKLDKLARHVPPSLELSYITPQIIGMAPPRCRYSDSGNGLMPPPISPGIATNSSLQMALHKTSKTKKQSHENDPAELSSFLEQRHSRRYLLFNVSDEDVDDRTLLLLGRQVVHLPWGSPRLNTNASQISASAASFERSNSNDCPVSPTPTHTRDSSRGSGINVGREGAAVPNNKSSQTPAVSRVMEICYAMHAYLTTSALRGKRSTIACVYCSNGKTRTGVVVACYLRFANKVRDAMSGFELFCERRGISPGLHQQHGERDMSGHIPPSLRQFFRNFDEVVELKRYPHPEPLLLQCVRLQGVPVDDMPCIDIWEHGDVARHQVYSSHDNVELNEWDDDEGSYNIGQILNRDFTLVCRFGGKFAQDADDPTKVLFRYVNSTKFLKDGGLELRMESVDMMRRYADSFDEEDFLLTLEFEGIEDARDTPNLPQKKKVPFASGLRFDPGRIGDRLLEGIDSILHGWRVISESHLSHVSIKAEDDLGLESSFFTLTCFGSEIDFRFIALQLTNGDIDLAKDELIRGLFGALFTYDDGSDDFGGSHYIHDTIETALSVESLAISERQKSIDEESYFTANDDEIEEETSIEQSIEESLEDKPLPPPQSQLDGESPFSGPGMVIIERTNASEQEEKTADASRLIATESIPDDPSHCYSKFQTLDLLTSHDGDDKDDLDASVSNRPFADRSRSSLLEAIKLRGLGKSMTSVGINDSRSSLLREITESARKRRQAVQDYKEPFPNVPYHLEEDSTPKGEGESFLNSFSPRSSTGDFDSESFTSDCAVMSPVPTVQDISDEIHSSDINQPFLDDADVVSSSQFVHEKQVESPPISSLGAAVAEAVKHTNDVEHQRDSKLLDNSESHFDDSKQSYMAHLIRADGDGDGDEPVINVTQVIPEVEPQQTSSIHREKVLVIGVDNANQREYASKYDCVQQSQADGLSLKMRVCAVETEVLESHTSVEEKEATDKVSNSTEEDLTVLESCSRDENIDKEMAEANESSGPNAVQCSLFTMSQQSKQQTILGSNASDTMNDDLDTGQSISFPAETNDAIVENISASASASASREIMEATNNEKEDNSDPRSALMSMLSKRVSLRNETPETTEPVGQIAYTGNEITLTTHSLEECPNLGASDNDNEMTSDNRTLLMAMFPKRKFPRDEEFKTSTSNCDGTTVEDNDAGHVESLDSKAAQNAMISNCNAPQIQYHEPTLPMNEGEVDSCMGKVEEIHDARARLVKEPEIDTSTNILEKEAKDGTITVESNETSGHDSTYNAMPLQLSHPFITHPLKNEGVESSVSGYGNNIIQLDPKLALTPIVSNHNSQLKKLSSPAQPHSEGLQVGENANAMEECKKEPSEALMAVRSKTIPPSDEAKPLKTNNEVSKVDVHHNEIEEAQPDPRAALMAMLSKRNPPPSAKPEPAQSNYAVSKRDTNSNDIDRIQCDPRAEVMSMPAKQIPPFKEVKRATDTNVESSEVCENVDKMEGTQPDPRAALMAMLSKRNPPPVDEPTPAMLSHESSEGDGHGSDTEKNEHDPRAALMAMLSKRNPPPSAKPESAQSNYAASKRDDNGNDIVKRYHPPEPWAQPSEINNNETEKHLQRQNDTSLNDSLPPGNIAPRPAAQSPLLENELPLSKDPKYEKYFRMLKMGLPIGAVQNAMQRDGLDPSIMDLDPDKSVASQRKSKYEGGPPLKDDPNYQKYFKMLKMGLPMGAVQNAMQRDGLDPTIMDLDPNKSVASQLKKEEDDGPPLKDDPSYQKYFKMLKMGLPMGAVQNAMQRDGLDPTIMDLDPNKSLASQLKKEVDDGPPLKDDPNYQKYFKMLKMGLPMGAVQNAMQRDGLDPTIMDLDPNKSLASQLKKEEDDGPPLKDDPNYQKYFKMLKMGLPLGAVKNALQRDGFDPTIMDLDPDKSLASQHSNDEKLVDNGPPLKDDPKYQKYFKMLKMGLPVGAVKNALQRDGMSPEIMDLDPEQSEEYQKAVASRRKSALKKTTTKEPKKPKVRRKKIYWSPIEESKIDDNSLWSMIKGSFDFDSLKVDQDEFESLFTDTSNPEDKKKVASEKTTTSKQKKSVQVIDAKRGMNGGIILARLKIDFAVLAEMVNNMDSGKLDDTQLKALLEFLPSQDEKAAIEQYIKDASSTEESKQAAINDFCACEKYMYAMMKVDKADKKFECMLFKYQFEHKLNELMGGVTTLINACEEVQKSVRLRKLMAMILMLGNQINTGGSGRMAHGFTLDALLKLDEAKAFDKKTSVLQYLVKLVKVNEPDLLKVHAEMPSICPAESVIVDGLISELKDLSERLKNVKETAVAEGNRYRDTKVASLSGTALDRLKQQRTKIKEIEGVNMYNQTESSELTPMEKFVAYAEKRTSEALARTDEVQELFKGVLTYFGEDPAMTSTDFFGTLNKFVGALDAAFEVVKRLEAQKAAEEKKAAAQRAREEAKKAQAPPDNVDESKHDPSRLVIERGKLDLSGQRKQYADPFPDKAQHTSPQFESNRLPIQRKQFADPFVGQSHPEHSDARDEKTTKSNNLPQALSTKTCFSDASHAVSMATNAESPTPPNGSSSRSPSLRFFPATSPGASESNQIITSRSERYKQKTSSSARTINKNLGTTSSSSENSIEYEQEGTKKDSGASLMDMLSKRPTPLSLRPDANKLSEKDTSIDATDSDENDAQPDPRAALMAMLSRRNPSSAEEPMSALLANNERDRKADVAKADGKEAPEQRNLFNAMSSRRTSPPNIGSETKVSAEKDTSVDVTCNSDKEAAQPDPRAALMAMLSRRNPSSAEEPVSALLANNEEDRKPDVAVADGKEAPEQRNLFYAMSSRRTSPPTIGSETKVSAEKDTSVDVTCNSDKEAAQPDPRAALMAMLSKRNPSSAEEPLSALLVNNEEDRKVNVDADKVVGSETKASAGKDTSVDETDVDDKDAQPDPRAALLALLSRQKPPPTEDAMSSLSTGKGDDGTLDADDVEQKEVQKSNETLNVMLPKFKLSPATGSDNKLSVLRDSIGYTSDRDAKNAQRDPRAAPMAMPSRRNQPATFDNSSAAKALESHLSTDDGESLTFDAANPVKDDTPATICESVNGTEGRAAVRKSKTRVPAHERRFLEDGPDSPSRCDRKVNDMSDLLADQHSQLDTENTQQCLSSISNFRNTTLFDNASNIELCPSVEIEPLHLNVPDSGLSQNDSDGIYRGNNGNEHHISGLSDKTSCASHPVSIAAMAAAAARKKSHSKGVTTPKLGGEGKSISKFSSTGSSAPMGIAAMAAAAARQKMILQQKNNSGAGGI